MPHENDSHNVIILKDIIKVALEARISKDTSEEFANAVLNGVPLPSNIIWPDWVLDGVSALRRIKIGEPA